MNITIDKDNNWKYVIFIVLIAFIIGCVCSWFIFDRINTKYNQTLNDTKNDLYKCIEEKTDVENSYISLNNEVIKLKNTIELIKDQNGFMQRDIAKYIKTRYTSIPKIIANEIAENVVKFSKVYNMSPELIVGMIEIESRFNPMSISSKQARGLMQVMPEWVPKLGLEKISDLHEIDVGIESGIKVFQIHLEEANGNISKGLYLYVGKNKEYSTLVFNCIGKFVTYRSIIDDSKKSSEEENSGNDEPAESNNKGLETTNNPQ